MRAASVGVELATSEGLPFADSHTLCLLPACLPAHLLAQEEFKRCFSMERDAFAKLPKWKQSDLKRKVRLF